jgi:hypothetical protein
MKRVDILPLAAFLVRCSGEDQSSLDLQISTSWTKFGICAERRLRQPGQDTICCLDVKASRGLVCTLDA